MRVSFTPTAGQQATQRLSVTKQGVEGNGDSWWAVWRPQQEQIAFVSEADNLVPGDTNDAADIFLKDLRAGTISRISTSQSGDQARYSSSPSWSPDGSRIAFISWGDNLVPGDTNGAADLFVKTLATGAIQRVSTTAQGGQISGDGVRPPSSITWSPDGTRLTFSSSSTDLMPELGLPTGYSQVYVKNLANEAIDLVSKDAAGKPGDLDSIGGQWSPDGTRIAFSSAATNLLAGDTNEAGDVFVKSLADGTVQRLSTDGAGGQTEWRRGSGGVRWAPDGSRLAFVSEASNLVVGDTNNELDLFVKSLADGSVTRVSTSASGAQGDAATEIGYWSPDGKQLAFSSRASNLSPGDGPMSSDVFVKSLTSGGIFRASVDSNGLPGNLLSYDPDWSSDGKYVAFTSSSTNLVLGDGNRSTDVFVRRVN